MCLLSSELPFNGRATIRLVRYIPSQVQPAKSRGVYYSMTAHDVNMVDGTWSATLIWENERGMCDVTNQCQCVNRRLIKCQQ